jgi:hypothetical protein
MWDNEKRKQFEHLRQCEAEGRLTDAEGEILRGLLTELDAEEATTLHPAIERMRTGHGELTAEKERVDQENERLAKILAKQERLLSEAQDYLNHIRAERAALREEYQTVTGR